MQHHILLAFRKRLLNRGYRNISICKARDENNNIKSDYYVVTATEPLTNTVVSAEFQLSSFYYLMR